MLLLGCFFLISCDKEKEEDDLENIAITNVFHEDFPSKKPPGIVMDSVCFIDSGEELEQITRHIPSIYKKARNMDLTRHTIIIAGTTQDYNILQSDVRIWYNTSSKVFNLVFSYILDTPPYFEKDYFRVYVCAIPEMPHKPHKFYVYSSVAGENIR